MKKVLLSLFSIAITASAFASPQAPKGEMTVTFAEHFELLTDGSESTPAEAELTSVPSSNTDSEWKGRGLHAAGGALAVMHFEQTDWFGTELVQGYIRTPFHDVRLDEGYFVARFRARTLSSESATIHMELYDPYTTNAIQTEKIDIDDAWTSYEVVFCHPGYGNHLAFLEMASEDEDWLIDDFEILQDYYTLPAPIVHFARNVTYEHFTARWNATPLASSYNVTVYSKDENGTPVYLVKDKNTTACTLDVEGTQKGTDYFYTVSSCSDKYTSEPSEERQVYVALNDLETPVTIEATGISQDGFTARWEPTFRAQGYVLNLSREYTATEDELKTLISEDFEKITDGTLDWPYPFYGNLDDITSIPGWDYNYLTVRVVEGMFGIDNSYKKYGEECHLTSPALDLSGDNGKFTLYFNIYGSKDDVLVVECGDQTVKHTLEKDGMQDFSLEFSNGTASTKFKITFDTERETYEPYLFIDDLKVQQYVHAGELVKENVGSYRTYTTDTEYVFSDLNANIGDKFCYTVSAWSRSLDEDGVWGPDVFSESSAPQYVSIEADGINGAETSATEVYGTTGAIVINTSENCAAEIYTISGMLLDSHAIHAGVNTLEYNHNGMLIVRVAGQSFRVIVR